MSERPITDLRVEFRADGSVDLARSGDELDTIEGIDDLVQALKLRLLVMQGELTRLGHPSYGSRVHELVGELLDRTNLELLRRYVRQALLGDPRVAAIRTLEVRPVLGEPGAVDVYAIVEPDPSRLVGGVFSLEVVLDVG